MKKFLFASIGVISGQKVLSYFFFSRPFAYFAGNILFLRDLCVKAASTSSTASLPVYERLAPAFRSST